jgi:hypothetical protein
MGSVNNIFVSTIKYKEWNWRRSPELISKMCTLSYIFTFDKKADSTSELCLPACSTHIKNVFGNIHWFYMASEPSMQLNKLHKEKTSGRYSIRRKFKVCSIRYQLRRQDVCWLFWCSPRSQNIFLSCITAIQMQVGSYILDMWSLWK